MYDYYTLPFPKPEFLSVSFNISFQEYSFKESEGSILRLIVGNI